MEIYPSIFEIKIDPTEFQNLFDDIDPFDIEGQSPIVDTCADKHPSLVDMTFIYLLSNSIYSEKNLYKIGKHKGNKKMLIRRYKTYLIEPIVYFFFPTGNASYDEITLLQRLSKFRMGTSEFVQLPLDDLLDMIQLYYRTKYERNPSVKILYHRCMFRSQLIDFDEKKINGKQCMMFPYLNFDNPNNCLQKIQYRIDGKQIFELILNDINPFLDFQENVYIKDFLKCFLIEFLKRNSIVYLDKFITNGLNDLTIQIMNEFYNYSTYKVLTRKEFLQKESFPERLILIQKSEEPLDIVIDKINMVQCCFIIEDKNMYSITNNEIIEDNIIEKLFYYLFYIYD